MDCAETIHTLAYSDGGQNWSNPPAPIFFIFFFIQRAVYSFDVPTDPL